MWNTVGNPFETTITAAHMVMAGVLERHPGLRVILAHGGGALPVLRGRLRRASTIRGWPDPETSIRRFYFDSVTHDPQVLRELAALRGRPDRARQRPPVRDGRPRPGGHGPRRGARPRRARRHRGAAARMTADVVVAGAGHNSLVTAAYLAVSGREVVVLDSRAIPGGGAATEELLGPGYRIDSCSTGHTLIQTNPLLTRGRAGAQGALRARVPRPRPVRARRLPGRPPADRVDGPRPHGRGDRAVLARRRRRLPPAAGRVRRGQAHLRRGHVQPARLRPAGRAAPARAPEGQRVAAPPRAERLGRDPARVRGRTHVQGFLLWQAYQTLVPVESPGSGPLAYSIVFGRQRRSWTIPRGGSGKLTDALVDCIVEHGGTVLCGKRVTRLVIEDGRCAGVETEDGDRFLAREAVVSTIHVKHLLDMAPAELWPDDFRYGIDTFDLGVPAMGVYMAADRAAGVRDAGRAADRRLGRPGRLPAGRARLRARARRRPLRRGPGLDPRRLPDAGRPVARPGGPPHGQAALRPVVRVRGAQGGAGAAPARAAARGRARTSPTTRSWPGSSRRRRTSSARTST